MIALDKQRFVILFSLTSCVWLGSSKQKLDKLILIAFLGISFPPFWSCLGGLESGGPLRYYCW